LRKGVEVSIRKVRRGLKQDDVAGGKVVEEDHGRSISSG